MIINKIVWLSIMKEFIRKYWFYINIIFIAAAAGYQAVKIITGKGVPEPEPVQSYTLFSVIFLLAGTFSLTAIYFIRDRKSIFLKLILLITGYTLLCFVYILEKDPALHWEGSDVAWYNYEAGEEVSRLGTCYVLSTWNTRANPFDTIYYSESFTPESKEMFNKEIYKGWMKKFTGDRWDTKELLVDKKNNRPYMHPPASPILIGWWLKIFPFGRYSAEILMIILNLLVFILLFTKYYREGTNSFYLLFFTVVAAPATVLFINPSAEHPTMMFAMLSVTLLLYKNLNNSFLFPLLSGFAAGLAFYSKFMMAFYAGFQIIALFIMYKRLTIKPLLGFTLGFITILIAFTLSGYYFWLTVLTGKVYAQVYINSIPPITFTEHTQKMLYFGLPLILVVLFLVYKIITAYKSFEHKHIVIPFLLGAAVYVASTWEVGAFNRYLFVYVPALFPFMYSAVKDIEFSKRDVLIVPIAGAVLLAAILFL
ncbi:MAG: glycosyltransferase family 39 protein [Ignavibacteria bacterium]|nr:glycosyltransferase family 39 protein [Ignavibacteria bacterium]